MRKYESSFWFARLFVALTIFFSIGVSTVSARELKDFWTKDSAAADEIKTYVEDITKKRSAHYVPPAARIAVFDLDGTVMCDTFPRPFDWLMLADIVKERGVRLPLEARSVAREITESYRGEKPVDLDDRVAKAAAAAYKGMTVAELMQRVDNVKARKADGFSGMTVGGAFRKPMLELIEYLKENDFTVYIVCDTERMTARRLVGQTLGIPGERVIGTDFSLTAGSQGDQPSDKYSMRASDKLVFDGKCAAHNVKTNKVVAIMREIGVQPVLAFGNDLSDSSMLNFVLADNPYKSMSFMVINDDDVRDYSDEFEADNVRQAATFNGWHRISVKKDFSVLYGKDVQKARSL